MIEDAGISRIDPADRPPKEEWPDRSDAHNQDAFRFKSLAYPRLRRANVYAQTTVMHSATDRGLDVTPFALPVEWDGIEP